MCKKDVDTYPSGDVHLIPCQVGVDWVGGRDKVPTIFYHKVKFRGAKVGGSYDLTVTIPTSIRGQSSPRGI